MQHYDVLIVTPGNKLEASYVKSLTSTLEECNKLGISFKWLNGQSSLVHHARELAIGGDQTLDPNDKGPMHDKVSYNKIFWIDSDIEWSTKDFFKLYNSDLEIVSGAYIIGNGIGTSVYSEKYNGVNGIPKDVVLGLKEPIEVMTIGFGFVCIKNGVFEKIERPWFSHFAQEIKNIRGEKLMASVGEDVSWCIRAHNANIPIHFDPEVLVNHVKQTTFRWD